ncbi:MAG: hypothetical protein CMQ23_00995, partial [Gammaproteobacteria bacterium]|nr:hypothetical protein [Gammaproteobacteria bacterium]
MNRTRTIAVLFVLLVLGLVAVALESRRSNQTERALWFPSLSDEIAGLSTIDIRQDGTGVRLERGAGGWGVAGRDHYPADIKRIIDLTTSLEQAEKIERKTAKPENHARLGLSNVPGEDGQGTLITLGLEAPVSMLVGQTAQQRDATFVRAPDNDQVWLVSGGIEASVDPAAWLSPVIFDVKEAFIRSIQVNHALEAESYALIKPDGALNWSMRDPIEGETLKYSTVLNQLPDRLTMLRLVDVDARPASMDAEGPEIVVDLSGGQRLALYPFMDTARFWLRVEVEHHAATTPEPLSDSADPDRGSEELAAAPVSEVSLGIAIAKDALPNWRSEISQSNYETLTQVKSEYFDAP